MLDLVTKESGGRRQDLHMASRLCEIAGVWQVEQAGGILLGICYMRVS